MSDQPAAVRNHRSEVARQRRFEKTLKKGDTPCEICGHGQLAHKHHPRRTYNWEIACGTCPPHEPKFLDPFEAMVGQASYE